MPSTIEPLYREFGPRGLGVLAVSISEPLATVRAWTQKSALTLPFAADPSGEVARAWGVTATPTVFLIGRDGKLVGKALGNRAWTGDKGRALLRALLEP